MAYNISALSLAIVGVLGCSPPAPVGNPPTFDPFAVDLTGYLSPTAPLGTFRLDDFHAQKRWLLVQEAGWW